VKQRRLELDYIAPPRQRIWPGMLVLGLSLAVAAELVVRYRDTQLELARLEAAASLIGPERRVARAVPKERLEEEMKSAEAVVRQLSVPWGSLVQAIEQAATRDVAVLQLQPDAESRSVRLTAEARNAEAMFDYLRRLAAANGIADAHLVSHQIQREDPQHPVQFTVQAALKVTP
jgi:Tfp pilus assembly protein PilN